MTSTDQALREPDDIRDRLSRAGRGSVGMTLAPMAASLVTQVWIGRDLGRLGLGEYHAASLFVTVLTTVLFFGFPTAVAQRVSALEESRGGRSRRPEDTALTVTLVIAVGMGIVGVAGWTAFTRMFGLRSDVQLGMVAAAVLLAAIANVVANVLIAKLRLRLATMVITAQPIAVALAILASVGPRSVTGVELALFGFVASGTVATLVWLAMGTRPRFDPSEAPTLLKGSLPATLWTYPSLVTGWVDRGIVGVILGPAALGAFVAASTLVEALQRLTRGLTTLGVPAYARLIEDPVGSSRVLDSHLRLMSAVLIVAGSGFIAAGSAFLSLIFGEGFAIATTTLRLLSIAALPIGIAIALASHGVGSDPSRSAGRILLLLLPTQIIVSAVATGIFHIAGTAFANLAVWSIGAALYLADARRRRAPVNPRTLLHIAGVGIPLFMFSWIVGLMPLPFPIRGISAVAAASLMVAVVLVREPERRLIRRVLPT